MKQKFIPLFNLPSLSGLFQNRIQKIPLLINNLKFKDVEEEQVLINTKQKIKNAILFNPLLIEEPKFIDFEYEERDVRFEQYIFGNPSKQNYIHQISYPFKGDKELFLHSPDQMSYLSSDHGIIEPSYNSITVYVELPELNPDKAIIEGNSLIRLTKDIGERNSHSVQSWNNSIDKKIDEDIEIKKSELIRIFGKR